MSFSRPDHSLGYRPALDGVRAVAVLWVFVFHAARPALTGGFIGVDVFFVLSGYLITKILVDKHDATGRVRFADFYARRVRRLMPALILVSATVAVREAIWGSLLEIGVRLRELITTLFYVANWNLISQSDDYFLEGTAASPLRHAWSLAVEEQFYLLWPLVLLGCLLIARRRRSITAVLVLGLAAASSLIMALLYDPSLPTRSYFGTDARVHQPLIGAALALLMSKAGRPRRWISTMAGLAALGGLSLTAWRLTGEAVAYYRGGSALIAVAAALLIWGLETAPNGPVARFLALRPFTELGKISYGFYLWHFPVILWMGVPEGAGFGDRRLVNLVQFGVTLALSFASFRLVEDPVRERRAFVGRLSPSATIAVGMAALSLTALGSFRILQVPGSGLAAAALADQSYEPCPENPKPCVKVEGVTGDSPTVVLIGDSTAQSYDPALQLLARKYGFRYVQAAVGGCPIGHRLLATGEDGELHKPSNFTCYEIMPDLYQQMLEQWDPELIIATSWNETNQHVLGEEVIQSGTPIHLSQTESALRDAVELLTSRGAGVAFIEILPPGPAVSCLETSEPNGDRCKRRVLPESGEAPYNALFEILAQDLEGVVSVKLGDFVCPGAVCPLIVDGVVMRYDGGHLTATASRLIAPIIDHRLRQEGVFLDALS